MSFDPQPYIDGILAANREERARIDERMRRALPEARAVAEEILRRDPATRRVILFGSLAGDGPKRVNFDIDLALDGGDTYRAMDGRR